jgi:hypothetical protein
MRSPLIIEDKYDCLIPPNGWIVAPEWLIVAVGILVYERC